MMMKKIKLLLVIFCAIKLNKEKQVMRTQFVECKYYYQAKKACPWVSVITKVQDGYKCFESVYDFEIWKNQK